MGFAVTDQIDEAQKSGQNFSMVLLIGDISYAGVSGSADGEELSESKYPHVLKIAFKHQKLANCSLGYLGRYVTKIIGLYSLSFHCRESCTKNNFVFFLDFISQMYKKTPISN